MHDPDEDNDVIKEWTDKLAAESGIDAFETALRSLRAHRESFQECMLAVGEVRVELANALSDAYAPVEAMEERARVTGNRQRYRNVAITAWGEPVDGFPEQVCDLIELFSDSCAFALAVRDWLNDAFVDTEHTVEADPRSVLPFPKRAEGE